MDRSSTQNVNQLLNEGKPHSMELDNDTLIGEWTKNYKTGMDFFPPL